MPRNKRQRCIVVSVKASRQQNLMSLPHQKSSNNRPRISGNPNLHRISAGSQFQNCNHRSQVTRAMYPVKTFININIDLGCLRSGAWECYTSRLCSNVSFHHKVLQGVCVGQSFNIDALRFTLLAVRTHGRDQGNLCHDGLCPCDPWF